jgi:putative PIN family toxin of toxin-antitoxin system
VIRAVLDTNVLAAGIVGVDVLTSTPGELIRRWRIGQFDLVISDHILNEVELTLVKPYFVNRLSAEWMIASVQLLRQRAIATTMSRSVTGVASHPQDDLVLATAISAGVDYLVTGDRELRQIGQYEGVWVVSPSQFLPVLSTVI